MLLSIGFGLDGDLVKKPGAAEHALDLREDDVGPSVGNHYVVACSWKHFFANAKASTWIDHRFYMKGFAEAISESFLHWKKQAQPR